MTVALIGPEVGWVQSRLLRPCKAYMPDPFCSVSSPWVWICCTTVVNRDSGHDGEEEGAEEGAVEEEGA